MSGLFGGGGSSDKYKRSAGFSTNNFIKRSKRQIKDKRHVRNLNKQTNFLRDPNSPLLKYSSDSPGWDVNVRNGSVDLERNPETQAYIDNLNENRGIIDSNFADLLGDIRPGMSIFRSERDKELEQMGRVRRDDMKSQLAKRRVLGASFAQDQLSGVDAETSRQRDLARAESWAMELQLTKEVIGERSKAFLNNIMQNLDLIKFEGALGQQYSQQAQQGQLKLAELRTGVAELGAKLRMEGDLARSGLIANLGGNYVNQLPAYAQLSAEEAAGDGSMVGSLLGFAGSLAAAPTTGGGSLIGNLIG